jgi:hypothetical protein
VKDSVEHSMDVAQVAERLYLAGLISYPRTETTRYDPSFDIEGALKIHVGNPMWGSIASELLKRPGGLQHPKGGVDAGDHPPITPVRGATRGSIRGDADWRVRFKFSSRSSLVQTYALGGCKLDIPCSLDDPSPCMYFSTHHHPKFSHEHRTTGPSARRALYRMACHRMVQPSFVCSITCFDVDALPLQLYELVARVFLGSLLPACKYTESVATLSLNGELFTYTWHTLKGAEMHFGQAMPWRLSSLNLLQGSKPFFGPSSTYPISGISLETGMTEPPTYLKESELVWCPTPETPVLRIFYAYSCNQGLAGLRIFYAYSCNLDEPLNP